MDISWVIWRSRQHVDFLQAIVSVSNESSQCAWSTNLKNSLNSFMLNAELRLVPKLQSAEDLESDTNGSKLTELEMRMAFMEVRKWD